MVFDLVVAAVIIVSAIISFLRGLIRETLTIAGMVGGLFMAYSFGDNLAPVFRNWFGVDPEEPGKLFDIIPMTLVADGTAYISIFVLFVIIISVASYFIGSAVKAMGLGPVDRSLGVVFGIVRAVILLALLYLPFHLLMEPEAKTEFFAESKTFTYIERTAAFMAGFLPSEEEVEEKIENVDEDSIKEKLFENDFLPGGDKKDKDDTPAPETGYDNTERKDLDQLLIEESEKDPLENKPVY